MHHQVVPLSGITAAPAGTPTQDDLRDVGSLQTLAVGFLAQADQIAAALHDSA